MKAAASIIICPKNRADSLRNTLLKMESVSFPDSLKPELIVVDNGSTDRTRGVVNAHRTDRYELKYVFEPRGGQAHARNRGLSIASSEIIVFTDDDVLPSTEWLKEHLRSYEDNQVFAVLGRIDALYTGPIPKEYSPEFGDFSTRFGDVTVKPFEGHLVGANMSFRRSVLDVIGAFNVRLGPGRSGFFDDTDFSIRLMKAGFTQCYEPKARVDHVIDPKRLLPEAFRRMLFQLGVSIYVADEFGRSEGVMRQILSFIRSTCGLVKYKIVYAARREQARCTHVDLSYAIVMGKMWARLQGKRSLERRYAIDL